MKISVLDRILLFVTGLLAAWQISVGIDHLSTLPIIAYTVGFGVLLVAGLLLIILGFDALESPIVVIVSTIIPLSLSLGLVWDHLPAYRTVYLAFTMAGFLAIVITRSALRVIPAVYEARTVTCWSPITGLALSAPEGSIDADEPVADQLALTTRMVVSLNVAVAV